MKALEPKNKLELYDRIRAVQKRYQKNLHPGTSCSPEEARGRLQKGEALLSPSDLALDETLWRGMLGELVELLDSTVASPPVPDPDPGKAWQTLRSLLPSGLPSAAGIEALSRATALDPVLLKSLFSAALFPFLSVQAEALKGTVDLSAWERGTCPVCGSEPGLGRFRREDGARMLFCLQCGTEWSFSRMKCPFCQNEDFDTLTYIYLEEDRGHRMDVCGRCKGYLKTVDERTLDREADLPGEDLATFHLDRAAIAQGFIPKRRSPWFQEQGAAD